MKLCDVFVGGAAIALLGAGCLPSFDGPYTCEPGWMTCGTMNNGDPSSNPGCETYVVNDPQNCGACGVVCNFGQTCSTGGCQQSFTILTQNVQPGALGIDGTDVFYFQTNSSLVEIPKDGSGSATPVALPAAQTPTPFAVDPSGNVYYVASGTMQAGGTTINVVPAAGGPATMVAPAPDVPLTGLELEGNDLFLLSGGVGGGSNALTVYSVPASGGTFQMIGVFPNVNFQPSQFAIDGHSIYAAVTGEQCLIQSIPRTGGSPTTVPTMGVQGCAVAIASDGTNVYWSTSATTFQSAQNMQACQGGALYATPVSGGPTATLAQFPSGEAGVGLSVSGSNVYAYTVGSVWRVPTTPDATPQQLAGNLQIRGPGSMGGTNCQAGQGGQGSFGIIAATTDVYVSMTDQSTGSNYLLRISE